MDVTTETCSQCFVGRFIPYVYRFSIGGSESGSYESRMECVDLIHMAVDVGM